ncbi:MAG: glutamine synthetase family protein [Alphaproteobacteria bacterium]|nr:glutamine synthetase family protein [Alphaproteobacteria bacterium]
MPELLSKAEVDAFLAAYPDLKGVDMLLPDMCGILRGKRIGAEALDKLYEKGVQMPGSTYLLDATGQNCETLVYGTSDGDPDYPCFGIAETLKPVPWASSPTGQVIATMLDKEGEPFFADPRQVLRLAAQPLVDMGLTPVVAIELEFYLIDAEFDPAGRPQPARPPAPAQRQSTTQVYGIEELYDFEAFLVDVETACQAQNVPADTATSEYAPGQYEINLHHVADPVDACDDALMLKRLIKGVARKHGMTASFMAKPFEELAGCGLHVHVSLVDAQGRNIFGAETEDAETGLPVAPALKHAIAGLKATMPDAMAIFAPNANSYRRFQANSYAPINTAWGVDNRTVSLRIPRGGAQDMRVEHRVAGADANPYLAVAAVLAGLHHGLANRLDPGRIERGNAYDTPPSGLPLRWWQALKTMADSSVLPAYLGAHYCESYVAARSFENDNFQAHIPALDYSWYLRTV